MEVFGRARLSAGITENFGNASNTFLRILNDLSKFWKIFGNFPKFLETSETVQNGFKIFGKSLEVFG